MTPTADFQLISSTQVPDMTIVMPMNLDAYSYLIDEAEMETYLDGSTSVKTASLDAFTAEAEKAHLCCSLAY